MTKNYSALHESMQTRTLANGLRICYLPKEGFSKTFAILATDFGSVDASFTFEGKRYDTPAGVAHFLEHKMFEDEDGNALQKFARTGASPNAFTSHTMTAYHFSCTDRFEENLKILLKFVFTPYFTDENVEKERGIINQEIRMVEDTPNWEVFVGAYEACTAIIRCACPFRAARRAFRILHRSCCTPVTVRFTVRRTWRLWCAAQRTSIRYAAWQRRFHRRTHPRSVSVITASAARKSISRW